MTLEEFKETSWYRSRSVVLKKFIDKMPPTQLYMFKSTKKQCYIHEYKVDKDDSKNITLTVQKTGKGKESVSRFDVEKVYDVKPEELEVWKDDTGSDDKTNNT